MLSNSLIRFIQIGGTVFVGAWLVAAAWIRLRELRPIWRAVRPLVVVLGTYGLAEWLGRLGAIPGRQLIASTCATIAVLLYVRLMLSPWQERFVQSWLPARPSREPLAPLTQVAMSMAVGTAALGSLALWYVRRDPTVETVTWASWGCAGGAALGAAAWEASTGRWLMGRRRPSA